MANKRSRTPVPVARPSAANDDSNVEYVVYKDGDGKTHRVTLDAFRKYEARGE